MNAHSLSVAELLAAGPRRGLGCANALAVEATTSPSLLRELIAALSDARPLVRTRAANALKKVQALQPSLLEPFAGPLLRQATRSQELQVRWNLMILLGDLPLRGRNKALAVDLFFEAMTSGSELERTFAMQGLANFAMDDPALRKRVQPLLENARENGSAAMRARARKLLPLLSDVRR